MFIAAGIALTGCHKTQEAKDDIDVFEISPITIQKELSPEVKNTKHLKKFKVNLRGYDLSELNLVDKEAELLSSTFDRTTVWTEKLPESFDPYTILETCKSPGLNIESLHKNGITGNGVSIGFIDYGLLVNHKEFEGRIKMYEEIDYPYDMASFHGGLVVSIAAGNDTGIAPNANIYAIGSTNYDTDSTEMKINLKSFAKAIDRFLEANKILPGTEKIKVISISCVWSPDDQGATEMKEAIQRASDEGVFVVSGRLFDTHGYYFYGLTINPNSDRNEFDSYTAYEWDHWLELISHVENSPEYYAKRFAEDQPEELILIPIDSKTTAGPTGSEDYLYHGQGGWSSGIPYIAGVYALALEADPEITAGEFLSMVLETGVYREVKINDKSYDGKIIDSVKLIERIQDNRLAE